MSNLTYASMAESLPEEVLLKIFVLLESKALCTAAGVCKRWNDIIKNSEILWKELSFTMDPHDREFLQERQKWTQSWRVSEPEIHEK